MTTRRARRRAACCRPTNRFAQRRRKRPRPRPMPTTRPERPTAWWRPDRPRSTRRWPPAIRPPPVCAAPKGNVTIRAQSAKPSVRSTMPRPPSSTRTRASPRPNVASSRRSGPSMTPGRTWSTPRRASTTRKRTNVAAPRSCARRRHRVRFRTTRRRRKRRETRRAACARPTRRSIPPCRHWPAARTRSSRRAGPGTARREPSCEPRPVATRPPTPGRIGPRQSLTLAPSSPRHRVLSPRPNVISTMPAGESTRPGVRVRPAPGPPMPPSTLHSPAGRSCRVHRISPRFERPSTRRSTPGDEPTPILPISNRKSASVSRPTRSCSSPTSPVESTR